MADATISSIASAVKADVAVVKADESKVVAFFKAHYTKAVAAVVGFAVSHFGVISAILHRVF
jgi:hypothetical protein